MEIRLERGRRFLRQPRLLSVPSRPGDGLGFSDPSHQSRLSMCPILARSSPAFRNLFSSLRDNNSCENYCERAADGAIPAGERETRMGYSRIGWAMGVVAPWCLGMALAVSISADAGQEASFGASWAPPWLCARQPRQPFWFRSNPRRNPLSFPSILAGSRAKQARSCGRQVCRSAATRNFAACPMKSNRAPF